MSLKGNCDTCMTSKLVSLMSLIEVYDIEDYNIEVWYSRPARHMFHDHIHP
jgi:hypothetical protein